MKIIKTCLICKSEFKSYDVGKRANTKCCSKVCADKSKKVLRVDRLYKECRYCGSGYKVLPHQTKKYCSIKCQHVDSRIRDKLTDSEKFERLKNSYNKFVIKKEGCWSWNGSLAGGGYGCLRYLDKPMAAHRVSWILHKGSIPEKMHVLHACDVKICSNPDHLFLGSHRDNMRDMRSKGYHKQYSKLNTSQVKEIKELLKTELTQKEIAQKYNVNFVTIHDIKHNKTWKTI